MKILIHRQGAFGDVVITTPLVRYLHEQGHEIYYMANERGMQILKGNPHIAQLIEIKTDSVPANQLAQHIERIQKKWKCEKVIDLSESIEVALSLHPRTPEYKLPKQEKLKRFNINFYEYQFTHTWNIDKSLLPSAWMFYDPELMKASMKPELFFTEDELSTARGYLLPGRFNILMGMSGSGTNKAWPWSMELAHRMCDEIPNVHIITVGDERCKLIEPEREVYITNLSGKVSMRTSMALTSLVDLVISPDTGLLHASGCYDTPKIGILGHTTRENITKHFTNDYSVESDASNAPCSPCFFLVYNMKLQCPIDKETHAALCMARGITTDMVMNKVKEIHARV